MTLTAASGPDVQSSEAVRYIRPGAILPRSIAAVKWPPGSASDNEFYKSPRKVQKIQVAVTHDVAEEVISAAP